MRAASRLDLWRERHVSAQQSLWPAKSCQVPQAPCGSTGGTEGTNSRLTASSTSFIGKATISEHPRSTACSTEHKTLTPCRSKVLSYSKELRSVRAASALMMLWGCYQLSQPLLAARGKYQAKRDSNEASALPSAAKSVYHAPATKHLMICSRQCWQHGLVTPQQLAELHCCLLQRLLESRAALSVAAGSRKDAICRSCISQMLRCKLSARLGPRPLPQTNAKITLVSSKCNWGERRRSTSSAHFQPATRDQ